MSTDNEQPPVAVVTGGSQGIGRAVVQQLCRQGARVVFCGHRRQEVDELNTELVAWADAVGVTADVRSAAQMHDLVDLATTRFGPVNHLVCSAGIQRYGTAADTPEHVWDEVLDVNLKGAFLACRAVLPGMVAAGRGSIVVVASVQSMAVQTNVAAYAASKAGLLGLVRSAAIDHAAAGIRVNAVCPASVDTPMLRAAAEVHGGSEGADQLLAEWGASHPVGRMARPEEVADVVSYLLSNRASFVTGAEVRVDGGMLAALPVALPDTSPGGHR